ncbi:MAG TPA: hypothetical protein VFE50_12675 [Cyclobacteriaceae bacterium]|nr:hypothetical protein [Cyclobacteriaceae bacterium]
MKNTLILTFISITTTFAQVPTVRNLDILIGTWEVEEIHSTSGWSEKATRTCYYIMDSTYIECESKAVSNDKHRTYRFLINYNTVDKQYEMVGIYSNWPLKQLDVLIPDDTGMKFRLSNSKALASDSQREGLIEFSSRDEYVWSGKNTNPKRGTSTVYTEKGRRKN